MSVLKKIAEWFKSLFNKKKEDEIKVLHKIANQAEHDELEKLLKNPPLKKGIGQDIFIVPLVFHIIHKGEPIGTGTNISDAQIYSAVNHLNKAYSKELQSKGDANGVVMPLRFQLANKDPYGNPTNGINRGNGDALSNAYKNNGIQSSSNNPGENEITVKTWSQWNNQKYYNIWSVSEINGNNGGAGVQGFAYYPTLNIVDGTVILFNALGSVLSEMTNGFSLKSYTNQNTTLVHELAHAFAIKHAFEASSCLNSDPTWDGDVNANYMSYASQGYRNSFAQCQAERSRLVSELSRMNLFKSDALDLLNTLNTDVHIELSQPPSIAAPNSDEYITVKLNNTGSNPIHRIVFEYSIDTKIEEFEWFGAILPNYTDTISIVKVPTDSTHNVGVRVVSINGNLKNSEYINKLMTIPTNKPYKVELLRDNLSGQISWYVADALSGEVHYKSPQYPNFQAGELDEHYIYLPDGDYVFVANDIQAGFANEESYIRFYKPDGTLALEITEAFSIVEFPFSVGVSGDLNNDGVINILDISKMLSHYGAVLGDPNFDPKADLNSDGMINLLDLSILIKDFNSQIEEQKRNSDRPEP